jgi:hypothetical protein
MTAAEQTTTTTAIDQLAHQAEQLGWRVTRNDRPNGRALLVLTRDGPAFDTWPSIHAWFDHGWFDRGYRYDGPTIDADLVTTCRSVVDSWIAG